MADVYLRNLDADVIAKLDEQAKKRGMSRNKYLIGILKNYIVASEIKELDAKYQEMFKLVIDSLEGNALLLQEILSVMKEKI